MTNSKSITRYSDNLASTLDKFFVGSLPGLPKGVKSFLVTITPYLIMIFSLLLLPVLLTGLGLGSLFIPLSFIGGLGTGFGYMISLFFIFGAFVLQIMAIPGLFKRSSHGWRLLYYASLITAVTNLFTANLGSFLLSTFISFYFLFQIRSMYKK